jgi:ubiquitin-protein ligase
LFREFPYPGGIEVWWDTPIFHPNIDKDGRVCIQLLNEWSGMQSLVNVVEGLKRMVENPNPDSPLNTEAAKYFSEKKGNQTKETKPRIIY